MPNLSRYRYARYQDGGRGNGVYDCWGWVRERGHLEYDWPLLASYGHIQPSDKKGLTQSAQQLRRLFEAVEQPEAGCIAEGISGKRSIHLGIVEYVDGQLMISHALKGSGICIQTIEQFKAVCGREIRYSKYVG